MADNDSDQSGDLPIEAKRPPLGGTDTASLFTGALVGAAFGALVAFFFRRRRADDEPPIRVKGGSIRFEVLDGDIYWMEEGHRKKWKLSDRSKATEKYVVDVTISAKGHTTTKTYRDVKEVTVHHDGDSGSVEVKSTGNHTKLTSSLYDMDQQMDPRFVTHPRSIKEIVLDKKTVVYRPEYGDLDELVIYDN